MTTSSTETSGSTSGSQERYDYRERDYRDRDYPRERDYRERDYRDRDGDRNGDRNGDRGGRERGIFISTEARPGILTSEFWLTLVGVAALIILAFAVDELGDRFGVACATAVLVGYILSRGIAKAGSSDTKRRRAD